MTRFDPDPRFEPSLADLVLPQAADEVARIANGYGYGAWMPRQRGPAIRAQGRGEDVTVVNTDYAGHLLEWGSRRIPARAPLRRAVRSAGFELKED